MLVNTTDYRFRSIEEEELKGYNPIFKTVSNRPENTQRVQLWKNEICFGNFPNTTVYADHIQIKQIGGHDLIHCAGHNITLYDSI